MRENGEQDTIYKYIINRGEIVIVRNANNEKRLSTTYITIEKSRNTTLLFLIVQ